jgi:hypothetical protein
MKHSQAKATLHMTAPAADSSSEYQHPQPEHSRYSNITAARKINPVFMLKTERPH